MRTLVARRVPEDATRARAATRRWAHHARRIVACLVLVFTLAATALGAQGTSPGGFTQELHRGDSAWSAQDYPAARAAYRRALEIDSTRSSRAVFRLATLESWDNQLSAAIAGFRRYVALEPRDDEGRIALARTLAWDARYSDAVAVYDSILRRDSTYRDAALGRAQALAWASSFNESIGAYRAWIAWHRDDVDARLALARTLSWAGQLDAAAAEYGGLLTGGSRLDAEKGLARVAAWRGDLRASDAQWRAVLARAPNDPEALTGLAQTVRSEGNPRLARDLLRRALAVQPSYGDAHAQLPWVEAELAPNAQPEVVYLTDSDDNRVSTATFGLSSEASWNGRVGVLARYRRASFDGQNATSASAIASADWATSDGDIVIRGRAGGARLDAESCSSGALVCRTGGSMSAIASAALAARVGAAGSAEVSVSRTPFDETETLIANRLVISAADASLSWGLPGGLTLGGGAGVAHVTGGTPNSRTSFAASVRRAWNRRFSLGASVREFGYDTTTTEGYFSPHQYLLTEASARFALGRDLGWSLGGEGGLGWQRIDLRGIVTSRMAERLRLSPGWRWRPGLEIGADVDVSNVASPGQIGRGEYHATTVAVRASIAF